MDPQTDSVDDSGSGAVATAQPAAAAPAAAPVQAPTQQARGDAAVQGVQPAAAAPAAPVVLKPVQRTGLAGLVDQIRDAISGKTSSHVATDENGDKYVKQDTLTGAQKWMRVAGTALRGATAGFAAGRGAGHMGDAAAAGLAAGDKEVAQRKQEAKDQNEEVKQAQLDKYNMIKLKHDITAGEFEFTRRKVAANEQDMTFSQGQQDREKTLGSADLGVFKDPADMTRVAEKVPDFWKKVYSNQIVQVPEIGPNGERLGIHLYMRTPGIGSQLAPEGTKVAFFQPGEKLGDPPKIVMKTPSIPMTQDQVDQANNATYAKVQEHQKSETDRKAKEADTEAKKQDALTQATVRAKNIAEAHQADANAAKARSESVPKTGDEAVMKDGASGLAEGRYVMGKDFPLRTAKDQTTAATLNKLANEESLRRFGIPYSPELVRQEAKMAENPKTQAFLTGIDRMVGTPSSPGQLDQVLDLAQKAGLGDHAPVSEIKLWIKQKLGFAAQKNFEQGLSDTQTAMGTLIGNPLLGSGESDMKLKTAQKQFGSDPTMGNLRGAVATSKEILGRARTDLVKNNRYLQQRYGEQLSPPQQAPPPPAPPGQVNVQIPGQPVGHVAQSALEQFQKDHPNAQVFK